MKGYIAFKPFYICKSEQNPIKHIDLATKKGYSEKEQF